MMKRVKIILDTDIGDDIDDAFALAFAINHPEIELLGVTTVFKHTQSRARQVKKYLDVVGRLDIPVYQGISDPRLEEIHYFKNDQPSQDGIVYPPQYEPSYGIYHVNQMHAVDFLIHQAKVNQGDLVIVPIGPLTNIAKAIEKDRTFKDNIKKIVLMGGWTTNPTPEWNILCDPEAADIVFSSGIDVYCVGLDVTLQCSVESDILELIKTHDSAHGRLLNLWFERWKKHFNFEKSVMHDPLAVATLISDVCTFEKKIIKVDLTNKRGAILVDEHQGYPVYVATKVDKNLFFKLFKETIYGV